MNKTIRDYLIKIGFNNKPLLDTLVEGIINNDISKCKTLLNKDEVRDIKMIMRVNELKIKLDKNYII